MSLKFFFLLVVLLFMCSSMKSQQFRAMTYNDIHYQMMELLSSDTIKPALIIYLHSRSGSGNDNKAQLNQTAVSEIKKYIKKNNLSAYFLVPQCPTSHEWISRDNSTDYVEKIEKLIQSYLSSKAIDTTRIYLCGASMGACGAWSLLKHHPNLFTAALITSGQAVRAYPSDYTHIPLYVTAGTKEKSYDALKRFTSEINKAGGNVQFEELPNLNHREACDKAFTAQRLAWLFSHK